MGTGMQWFRVYTDFLEDSKIVGLAFEDQRHFIGVLALKASGVLDQECDSRLRNRIVAQRLWIGADAIEEVKRRLIEAKLIDSEWQPLAWSKRQYVSDHDPSGAERQRRYREKHRNALRNASGDASVTPPDTETDTDLETEKEKKNSPRVARPESVSEQAWKDWLAVRKAKRAGPVTPTALARLENEAQRAGYSLQAAVEEAAARGWQSFRAEWVAGQQSDNAMAGAL